MAQLITGTTEQSENSALTAEVALKLSPPLKWAGGKRWQVPLIQPLWSKFPAARLVEPFCGGMAVALGLKPAQALLNDVNPHLINFYRWLQKGLICDLPMRLDEKLYYNHRDRFNELIATGKWASIEAAQLFYYLNRTGYNGLCRFNRTGEFNVPYGKYKVVSYTKDFMPFKSALKQWRFECGDFEQLDLAASDFVYADPPYDVEFTSYSQGGFDWDDQERLARWLAVHKGPVVLVNQSTDRVVNLYRELGFSIEEVKGPRRISCTGDRSPATEVIATRNIPIIKGRNTSTGRVLEDTIVPSLRRGGYDVALQVDLGRTLGQRRHVVDAVAKKAGTSVLVSVKWQQVSGTAEEKVPFEVVRLLAALENSKYERAYIVLGGTGWRWRDYYTSGQMNKYFHNSDRICIVSLEQFIASANSGGL